MSSSSAVRSMISGDCVAASFVAGDPRSVPHLEMNKMAVGELYILSIIELNEPSDGMKLLRISWVVSAGVEVFTP